ncbi:Dynlt1 [Symbiodinium natans]|uniref:Poly [ADP-ribose] polymerase n=1 Tax=Symbiodinium natans TaxID=878477 RepID=A0A812J965_9DINO|nr:Dynlt1 [Symbiodinium natans]
MLRTLAESSSEFRRLSEHVVRTGAAPSRDRFGSSERTVQKALQVFRIERILMSDAETKYREQRMNMFLDRGASRCELQDCCALRPDSFHDLDIGLDELLLYHGCRAGSIHGILHEGFDPSRSGERAGQFFGCGTYFADVAAKADSYVDVAPDGVRCIIVAQVCLGKALRALRAMPRFHPSCREAEDEGPACDSVIGEDTKHGGILDHREYVIYRGAQAIPRYLVGLTLCSADGIASIATACCGFKCCGRSRGQHIARSASPAVHLREAELLALAALRQRGEVNEVVKNAITKSQYSKERVTSWTNQIIDECLKELAKLNKPFKYVVTCIIMQKSGAPLHTGIALHWDTKTDGTACVQVGTDTMDCITTVCACMI